MVASVDCIFFLWIRPPPTSTCTYNLFTDTTLFRSGLCGLRATFRERGRSEEWPGESGMWPGTGREADRCSPQASAGTPNNTRGPARSGKKKPQPRTVGVWVLVEPGGIEPPSASPLQAVLHA